MSRVFAGRRAGIVLPLFSCPSTRSWGIGEIGDVPDVTRWMTTAGLQVLQLLPLNEMAAGQHSPYSPLSAMAIDPIYISVEAVPEFAASGGEASLDAGERDALARARQSPRVDHATIRPLKASALRRAFDRFHESEWSRDTPRAQRFRTFLSQQAWWVEDYALFRAVHAREEERSWTEWPDALQRRDTAAIDRARKELARDVLYRQYLQWIASDQWTEARRGAGGVAIFGDLPFMVDRDSADVWARQQEFDLGVSVGAPPDDFSKTGQDWGMPAYKWDAIAAEELRWLRERARRTADLFDGYRIDHVVGFYRTYLHPRGGGAPFFSPPDEPSQAALGDRVMTVFKDAGAEVLAEDLGTVPDFVRASLWRLHVPGFRIFRWERHWHTEGHPFRDPSEYPELSVAASGTHDTEPLMAWWEQASPLERSQASALPTMHRVALRSIADLPAEPAREAIIEALFASGSSLLLMPIQDVFGWHDRINDPATMDRANWTFKLPWPSDRLDDNPAAQACRDQLRSWSEKHRR